MAEKPKVTKKVSEDKASDKSAPKSDKMLALIRIRGETGIEKSTKDTLDMLNLYKKFNCVIVPKNKVYDGMIEKAKDFITFGEIDAETMKLLDEKRNKGERKFYSLHPPRGGFEKKGTKRTYVEGGVLGNRKTEINALIKRMI